MTTLEEDTRLREIIRDLRLDSPGKDFTMNVMERIHKEVPFTFQIKKDPVLGKGFWIIIGLFVVLTAAMILLSPNGTGEENVIGQLFNSLNTESAESSYKGFLGRMTNIPAGIAAILLGSSLLVFIERILSLKKWKIT